MLFIISVAITMLIVPVVTGGYNYQLPSRILEQPPIQSPYNNGQLKIQNVPAGNVVPLNSYQSNIYTQNVRSTVNGQQPPQTFNYQVPPNQVFPPLAVTDQRPGFPMAIGVQPPNIRNIIRPVVTNPEITSPAAIQSQTITSNSVPYNLASPVFNGFQPFVSQAPYIPPQTIQQLNQATTSKVVNIQSVEKQQQYNNVEVTQEQVYINNNDPQNFVSKYPNQQTDVRLSNSLIGNNNVGGNAGQINVVNANSVLGNVVTSVPAVATPQTIITKHVYFHAPPPDISEAPIVNTIRQPAKKTFNIIFIKVPSQEYLNRAHILKQLQGRQNSVDKTLIYVLVKRRESYLAPVLGQTSQPSKPEVFFVKYKNEHHREERAIVGNSASSFNSS